MNRARTVDCGSLRLVAILVWDHGQQISAVSSGTGKLCRVSDDEEAFAVRFKLQRSNDPKQPYYFEIQAAGNYETLATSETYVSKADAQHAIDLIKSGAAGATVVDVT